MLIKIDHEIDQITLQRGDTFTVWLNVQGNIQVELRVKKDGTPEMFSDKKSIILQDFEDWYNDENT